MMHTAQALIGSVVIAGALSLAFDTVAPEVKPIVVHELSFDGQIMSQDRTVTTDGKVFFARWEAQVIDAETGDVVPWCKGGMPWNYDAGHKVYQDTLENWVGSPACTVDSLPSGQYQGVATWYWGTDQTSKSSNIFVIE